MREVTRAEQLMGDARLDLMIDYPFWGSLAMRLILREVNSPKVPEITVNGNLCGFNGDYIEELSPEERIAVLAHQVSHCAFRHPFRRNDRNNETWNISGDKVINPMLIEAGFKLPAGADMDMTYKGDYAEEVYSKLQQQASQQPQGGGGQGQGQPQKGQKGQKGQGQPQQGPGTGDFRDPDTEPDSNGEGEEGGEGLTTDEWDALVSLYEDQQWGEYDWEIAAEQAAAAAQRAGKLPAGIKRAIKVSDEDTQNWKEILRRFIEQTIPSDYSMVHPNRRFISQNVYLPGVRKENCPWLAIAIDTSGSITGPLISTFAAEMKGILEDVIPEYIEVTYCDAVVHNTQIFTPEDAFNLEHMVDAKGGGGTAFKPIFDRIKAKTIVEGQQPCCLIYFTDLENFGETIPPPEFTTIWVVPEWQKQQAVDRPGIGFGETIRIPTP